METYGERFRREVAQATRSLDKKGEASDRVVRRMDAWANSAPEFIDSKDPQRALLYLVATHGNITDQTLHMLGDLGRILSWRVVTPLWIIAGVLAMILWRVW